MNDQLLVMSVVFVTILAIVGLVIYVDRKEKKEREKMMEYLFKLKYFLKTLKKGLCELKRSKKQPSVLIYAYNRLDELPFPTCGFRFHLKPYRKMFEDIGQRILDFKDIRSPEEHFLKKYFNQCINNKISFLEEWIKEIKE